MSGARPNKKRAEALMDFCNKVKIPEAEAKEPEPPFYYNLNIELTVGALKAASVPYYTSLKDVFDKSLILLKVNWGTKDYILIERGEIKCDLAKGVAEINNLGDAAKLTLQIEIDKTIIIEQMGLDQTLYNCWFYLFEQNLAVLFSSSLLKLDDELFKKPGVDEATSKATESNKPIVIVVSDADIYFAGEALTIVGEGSLEEAAKALTQLSAARQKEIQEYRASLQHLMIVGQQFERLTPLHFLGKWREKDKSPLQKILAQQFANICILYTANRSKIDTNDEKRPSESVYSNSERKTTLSLKNDATAEINTTALEGLVIWLRTGKEIDQLTIFQNIVVRELYSEDDVVNYNSFIILLDRLLTQAKWHYQKFLDGKITKHFEQVQKVVEYVADVNKKISEAIDSVTKSLSDTLMATVGALVLTVLAALVKKDTSFEIFRISMRIYAAYLVFYAIYRMASILHSYLLLSGSANVQLGAYEAVLGSDKIETLKPPLKSRRRQFHIWFWLTCALYLALAGLIFWLGDKGPELLTKWGILSPVPPPPPGQ
jgi:hypothetical protein